VDPHNARTFGQTVEADAAVYLRQKGYRILEQNLCLPMGELDVVAEQDGTLVFIEVKGRRTTGYGGTAFAVDARKQARLVRLAAQYLSQRRLQNQSCRFDVVLCQESVERSGVFEHIENAFEVPGDDLRW
jgi:putative endonuclease